MQYMIDLKEKATELAKPLGVIENMKRGRVNQEDKGNVHFDSYY
jgi:hypothetical protein